MPETTRTINGQTAQWDGQGWVPVSVPESALSRFVGGAVSTSPFNPMNLYRAARHPIDALGNLFEAQMGEGQKAYTEYEKGHYPEMLGHGAAALLPLIGPMAAHIGERVGEGDFAGGIGEGAGLASSALFPSVVKGTPAGVSKLGRGMETAGRATQPLSKYAVLESLIHLDPYGVAAASVPYALEYGGKGLQKVGGGLEQLKSSLTQKTAAPRPRVSTEVPYQMKRTPAPSTNPLSDALPPPAPDAWSALNTIRNRVESPVSSASSKPLLDQAAHEATSGALPDEIRQRVTRAAGGEPVSLAGLRPEPVPEPYTGLPGQERYRVYAGGEEAVQPTILESRLPDSLRQDILDLDQAYQRHTYDQRMPYLRR